MKSLDAFGRPVQEFQVKTTFGGYLSLCAFALVAILFVTELRYFMELESKDEMVVDQNQDLKYLNITIDMTLPSIPCAVLSLNLMDPKRANVMHVVHEIYKTRLSKTGRVLGRRVRDSLSNVAQTPTELAAAGGHGAGVRTTHATTHLRCPSCFQTHIDEDDCCEGCDEVRQEFRKRGWNDRPTDYVFGQCVEEAYVRETPQEGEGCRIEAMLHVRKVPAILHFGVGRHFPAKLVKFSSSLEEFVTTLDFSHDIHTLSFGPDFPGLVKVLDGRHKRNHAEHTSEHYQYDVHVIPTAYQEDGADEVVSHQYSVTEYVKPVDPRQRRQDTASATGLWLSYDFTPFEVKVTKSRKSILHFITECCAILGGIFAFTGMIDNFAYQINKSLSSAFRRKAGSNIPA